MTAYELMLSESQERMLVVVKQGHEDEVRRIFDKWDLHAEVIGEVTDGERLVVSYKGKTVADVPADSLVLGGGAPVYIRETREPEYLARTRIFDPETIACPDDLGSVLLKLLASPNIASKKWVSQQYDHMVRTNNVVLDGADAGILLLKECDKALAVTTDCNARYVYLNPYRGGLIAVAEAARNVVCSGAEPLAITNCLNFGNPYDPEVYWQFREAVRGIGDACRVFSTPVTGGNVSFYNESPQGAVYPTPVIGMVGLVQALSDVTTAWFKDEGDVIALLGRNIGHLGATEYLEVIHGVVAGEPPPLDLESEKNVMRACLAAIRKGIVKSAHDCSEGGLAVAIAEGCILNLERPIGATIRQAVGPTRDDAHLFGEDQARIVVTSSRMRYPELQALCNHIGAECTEIGFVGGDHLRVEEAIDVHCEELREAYYNAIGRAMMNFT
jgi:phosphoribosylformylglycinamidine synthase